MPDDPAVSDPAQPGNGGASPAPTAEELAGTIFEGVGDFRNDNGGGLLTSEAAIGGGDG